MPSTLLRLAVALLTFGLGVTATTLWIAYRTPDVQRFEHGTRHVLPLPPLPTVEEPPPPPSPLDEPPPHLLVLLSGDGLERKLISKPVPLYPPIAKAARAFGTVRVQVTVGEEGKVMSAIAISGHPLLQQAAVQAVYQARFAPTVLGGQPVDVSGILSYNFVLP